VYLDTMVAVGKVVHGFVLFVNDANARFVGADGDGFDVFGGFASLFEVCVNVLCGFDGGLGMEFG